MRLVIVISILVRSRNGDLRHLHIEFQLGHGFTEFGQRRNCALMGLDGDSSIVTCHTMSED